MIIEHIFGGLSSMKRYIQNLIDSPMAVLIYHRILDAKNDPQMLCVSPENFHMQVEHFKKHYNVLSADEFYDMVSKKKEFKKRSVVLTFDDGYYDNYENALPILENLDISALFFISTSNIDKNSLFFWDELEIIFDSIDADVKNLKFDFCGFSFYYKLDSTQARDESYRTLHYDLKYCKQSARKDFLIKLREAAGISCERIEQISNGFRSMKTEEIKKMSVSKSAVIGAHTHTHTPLSVYGYNEQYTDMIMSKNILEKIAGRKIDYFSYPFGSEDDYDADSVKICGELGFKLAFSNFYGQVHSWTDKFQIPRMLVRNWEHEYFKNQVEKFFRR